MASLRSVKARRGTRHWDYGDAFDPGLAKKDLDPTKVFDLAKEQEAFSKTVLPVVTNVYTTFGEGTSQSLGVAFNLRDPVVAQDILERDNRLRGTVDTTWHAVQDAIIDGEALGEGIDGISKRIGQVFEQAKGYRARMIARTETIGASNAASLYAAESSGVVGKKTWLAASDPRTRPSHVSADGQTVAVDKPFFVGASKMQHPGDPNGGAHETVNCRCSMVFQRSVEQDVHADDWLNEPAGTALDVRARRVEDAVAEGRTKGLDTHETFQGKRGPGSYTHERWVQQEDLLDELWAEAADVPNEGEAVFSGGLGGAGKGTVLKSAESGVDPERFFTIDPDKIKEAMARRGMIPTVEGFEDLSPMELSALIHEESSHLASRLALRATAERKNVVFDITMSSQHSVEKRLLLLRDAGYEKVDMIFVDIPVETSVDRALARWERGLADYLKGEGEGGRYVPPEIIRAQADEVWGSVNRRVFEDLKDQADNWRLFDNSGAAPRLVEEKVAEVVDATRTLTRTGVDLAEEMPAGLTRAEQTEWFQAKWGKALRYSGQEVDRVVAFDSIPGLEAHEKILRALDAEFSNLPSVADNIPKVGTFKDLGIRTGGNVMGQASRGDYLALSERAVGTIADAEALAARNYSQGWWSSSDPLGILHHEFGHHVHYTFERDVSQTFGLDNRAAVRDFLKPLLKEASGLKGNISPSSGQGLNWIRTNVSKYATTNPYEVVAECWAEYQTMGTACRPFARSVGEALEAAIREATPAARPIGRWEAAGG